mgnify:CR=1 FL=1
MILSMHQPNFIPWLGYFDKIKKSDVFVILDNVQYPRGKSVANRNKIKIAQDSKEIVVPISRPKGYEGKVTYRGVEFGDLKWYKKALKTIQMNYSRAPFFDYYYTKLESLFQMDNFCEMNIAFIKFAMDELKIDTPVYLLSDSGNVNYFKNDLIIYLCNTNGADVYLSGKGAQKYNDEEKLNAHGIQLKYLSFEHPVYPQLHGEFISHLSVIDLLFNCGDESYKYLNSKS